LAHSQSEIWAKPLIPARVS